MYNWDQHIADAAAAWMAGDWDWEPTPKQLAEYRKGLEPKKVPA